MPSTENNSETNRPVRWGVLGTARIATKVAAGINATPGAELTAIASRSLEKAQAWAGEHGASESYGSYQQLLEEADVDAIYIPLPPAYHAEWTLKCAERGKHVLCEKPVGMNLAEAEEMWAACKQNNVQLMDGVMWVHHPRTADMQKILDSGSLGELKRVTSAFSLHWGEGLESDIRMQRNLGLGSLGDLGWYNVRATWWAFRELPTRVFGTARYLNDADIYFSGTMWFDNSNRMASFDCGFDTAIRKWFEIAGTESSLVCDDFLKPWKEERPRFWTHGTDGESTEHISAGEDQIVCMISDFDEIVRSGQLDPQWPEQTLATRKICDAFDQSARSEKIVEL